MSFDWKLYLQLANELSGDAREECLRSAISRAYYAAYCKAVRYLGWDRRRPYGAGSHDTVWDELKRRGGVDMSIGNAGALLKKSRKAVDYDDAVPDLNTAVVKSIRRAQAILDQLP